MSSQKRPPYTDAMVSLGDHPPIDARPDLLHLAAKPMIAGVRLRPGQRVFFKGHSPLAFSELRKPDGVCITGIVDPFLSKTVLSGCWFWCIFPPSPLKEGEKEAQDWLRHFCKENRLDYDGLWEMVDDIKAGKSEGLVGDMGQWYAISDGDGFDREDIRVTGEGETNDFELPEEFWEYIKIVTGKMIPANFRAPE